MFKHARLLLINLAIIAGSSFFGILLIEGFMHFSGRDYALLFEPDRKLGWHIIPRARKRWTEEGNGLVEINNLGYRDRERQLEKPPDTFRIAVFGDSMTQAVQVNLDQTFTYLLEEKLRRRNPHVEIMNFGVNGYSPIQELLLFKQEGPRYRPDLVILALFLDNDVSGVHPNLTVVSQSGPPFVVFDDETMHFDFSQAEQSFAHYHREPWYTLRKYSALYRLTSDWCWRRKGVDHTLTSSGNTIPQRYRLYQQPVQPEWEEAWTIFERVVLEFAEEARQQQTDLVILSVPAAQVINHNAWQSILNTFLGMRSVEWDLEGPERRLRTFASEHGLLLLQPYKAYQGASQGSPLFFGNVGHMTPRGHQLMANIMEDSLYKHGQDGGSAKGAIAHSN